MDRMIYLKMATGIFSVLNPLGAVPVFISLTSGDEPIKKNQTAATASLTTAIVLIAAAFTGEAILRFFGISMASFRVGGGILLLLMAISMLHARISTTKHSPEEGREAVEKDSVAVVPLAIPLLAGPGSISTVILYSHYDNTWLHLFILSGIIAVMGCVTWALLRMSDRVGKAMGTTGINIAGRLMGLILAAIAVEFIARGLTGLFPVLGR